MCHVTTLISDYIDHILLVLLPQKTLFIKNIKMRIQLSLEIYTLSIVIIMIFQHNKLTIYDTHSI